MSVKVFYLITELNIGGAERVLARLMVHLDRDRFTSIVACFYGGDGPVAEEIRTLNIPVIDLGMTAKWRWDALWRLYRLLRRERPTVLHTWMFHANIPGRVLGRLTGVPVIISSERTMGQEGPLRRWLNCLTVSLADQVVCVSQRVADFAAQTIGLPREKLVVVPNGIALADFASLPSQAQVRAAFHLPAEATIIGAIGRPRLVKGYHVLLDAFAQLAPAYPAARLLFVGNGPDRQALITQAIQLNLNARVIFFNDQSDIPCFLPALDLLALSSFYEGMPNVALEAMAAGLPVVATAVGGTPEVVVDGVTGLLVPPRDHVALAEAIACLLQAPDLRRRMGQAGRERVKKRFTVERMVSRTEALYRELIAEKLGLEYIEGAR
jgi:glycosyltransferase involved in cell wall biosynthesis